MHVGKRQRQQRRGDACARAEDAVRVRVGPPGAGVDLGVDAQRLRRFLHPAQHRRVDSRAHAKAHLLHGHGLPGVRARGRGVADVKGHGHVRRAGVSRGHGAEGADLLLDGGAELDRAGQVVVLQLLHGQDHRRHARAVVKRLVGDAVVEQTRHGDLEVDGVARAHEGFYLFLGQAHVHGELRRVRGLERALAQVRGQRADDAVEGLFAPDRDLASRQGAGVHAAQLPQAAVVRHAPGDQAHLVHVRADEHARAAAAHDAVHAAELVDKHILCVLRELLRDARGGCALHARVAGDGANFL